MGDDRRDPFAGMGEEPVEALGLTNGLPGGLARRPRGGRKQARRPAEKRRKARQVSVTFSTPEIPARLRALALEWGLLAPDGRSPSVSAVVERLLVPALEAAEAGELEPGGECD